MKKAQAAMEFLMTYGWAILVVLAAISALAYFGVLNPGKMVPDMASGFTGLMPIGKPTVDASAGKIYLTMSNNLGTSINIQSGTYTSTTGATSCSVGFCSGAGSTSCNGGSGQSTLNNIDAGSEFTVIISCTGLSNEDREKGTLTIEYKNQLSGLTDKASGTIQVKTK